MQCKAVKKKAGQFGSLHKIPNFIFYFSMKRKYILKVDREMTIRGKTYDHVFYAGIEKGSMIFKPKIEDAQVFNTKKDAMYWYRYTGGEIIELGKVSLKKK
jgi:hypothetical protein